MIVTPYRNDTVIHRKKNIKNQNVLAFDRVKRSLIKKSREPYKAMRAYHRSRTSSFYVLRLFPVLFCIF